MHYPRMSMIAKLTGPERLRVSMDEKRGHVLARFFRALHAHLSSPLKA